MKNILKTYLFAIAIAVSVNAVNASEHPPYTEDISANEAHEEKDSSLGKKLEAAFHNKDQVEQLRELIKQEAPVNYRLDYGLPLKDESDFVASFYILLGGLEGEKNILSNAQFMLNHKDHANGLYNYVRTAMDIFNLFHDPLANQVSIPLNPKFEDYLIEHASSIRANPDHKNGSLIIAAGLKNPALIRQVLKAGCESHVDENLNGASVNFIGHFGDTAAVWSAILLDAPSLKVLLEEGAQTTNLGITKSSLLHWAVCAGRLDESEERFEDTRSTIKLLLSKDPNLLSTPNIFGKIPMDYADERLKNILALD